MADSVVWAPMRDWPAAMVPKTTVGGLRVWDSDGPTQPAFAYEMLSSYVWAIYRRVGPRLICIKQRSRQ